MIYNEKEKQKQKFRCFLLVWFLGWLIVLTLESTDPVKCRSGSSGISKEGKHAVNIKHASLLIASMLNTILVQFCALYQKKQARNNQ